MADRAAHDPFAPRSGGARRPRRSTSETALPDWLFDALRERGVPDEAADTLRTQFEALNPAERAGALADLQTFRRNVAEIDDLAAALVEYHENGADDAGDDDSGGEGSGASEAVTPASGDQGGADHVPDRVVDPHETIAARNDGVPDAPLPTDDEGRVDTEVPRNATEVVSWIVDAGDDETSAARARAALTVEIQYPSMRKTVRTAIEAAIGEEAVQAAIDGRG